jgi:hypothetical protein
MQHLFGKLASGTAMLSEAVLVMLAVGAMVMLAVAVVSHIFGG